MTLSDGWAQRVNPAVTQMAERTYEELFAAAQKQRQEWIDAGEPNDGADGFIVTPHERLLINDRRPPCYELSSSRHRIFGLLIIVQPRNALAEPSK